MSLQVATQVVACSQGAVEESTKALLALLMPTNSEQPFVTDHSEDQPTRGGAVLPLRMLFLACLRRAGTPWNGALAPGTSDNGSMP